MSVCITTFAHVRIGAGQPPCLLDFWGLLRLHRQVQDPHPPPPRSGLPLHWRCQGHCQGVCGLWYVYRCISGYYMRRIFVRRKRLQGCTRIAYACVHCVHQRRQVHAGIHMCNYAYICTVFYIAARWRRVHTHVHVYISVHQYMRMHILALCNFALTSRLHTHTDLHLYTLSRTHSMYICVLTHTHAFNTYTGSRRRQCQVR